MPAPISVRPALAQRFHALYVAVLLRLLPHLLNLFRPFSQKIRAEIDYLTPGYTFMLAVRGTGLSCVCRRSARGTFRRVSPEDIARDVEPGSGLDSVGGQAVTVDYVITFRSLTPAFECFAGSLTLQGALAQRAFATRGPNNTGVALTYMFTALLKMFFGWRAAYRAGRSTKPVAR